MPPLNAIFRSWKSNHAPNRNHSPVQISPGSKLLLDSCSMMHCDIECFFKNEAPGLVSKCVDIIVSKSCMDELARLHRSPVRETAVAATKAWNTIITYQKAGLCQICGDFDDETHADPVFLYVILKYRRRFPVFVVTQDNDLADDIELTNHLKSTHCTNKAKALKMMPDGSLKERKRHV